MGFTIKVQNNGEDGTVEVIERINLNERQQVFLGVLSAGETRDIQCAGSPPKEFDWIHHATNLSDGPVSLGDGDTLAVNS